MFERLCLPSVGLFVALVCLGCQPPSVPVRHDMGTPVPLPEGTTSFEVTRFDVKGDPSEGVGSYTADTLAGCLSAAWVVQPGGLQVGGTVTVETESTRGTRMVRRGVPGKDPLHVMELPSLKLSATVTVRFVAARPGSPEPWVITEMTREYKSTDDPRVRGELALGRPDDPERVPPAEQVVRELIDQCIESYCSMLKPLIIDKQVQLRDPGAFGGGGGVFEAVREGELYKAQRLLSEAVADHPDSPELHFNLGAVSESVGDLETARTHFNRAAELTRRQDAGMVEAADRVRQVLAVRAVTYPTR